MSSMSYFQKQHTNASGSVMYLLSNGTKDLEENKYQLGGSIFVFYKQQKNAGGIVSDGSLSKEYDSEENKYRACA